MPFPLVFHIFAPFTIAAQTISTVFWYVRARRYFKSYGRILSARYNVHVNNISTGGKFDIHQYDFIKQFWTGINANLNSLGGTTRFKNPASTSFQVSSHCRDCGKYNDINVLVWSIHSWLTCFLLKMCQVGHAHERLIIYVLRSAGIFCARLSRHSEVRCRINDIWELLVWLARGLLSV